MPIAIDSLIINRRRGGVVCKARAALDFAVILLASFFNTKCPSVDEDCVALRADLIKIFARCLSLAFHCIDMQYAYSTFNLLIKSIV